METVSVTSAVCVVKGAFFVPLYHNADSAFRHIWRELWAYIQDNINCSVDICLEQGPITARSYISNRLLVNCVSIRWWTY